VTSASVSLRVRACVAILGASLVLAAPAAGAAVVPNDSQPYWSWDARMLAFQRESPRLDNGHVLFTPAGRGDEADVIGSGLVRGWRPGGAELLVGLDGSTSVRTAADRQVADVGGVEATWSPDGGRIAYLQGQALYVADATGANVRQLAAGVVPPAADQSGPVWSPDGTEIAIAASTSPITSELLAVPVDGSASTVVFDGPGQNANPSWSENGSWLAFERDAGGAWAIWLVHPTGADAAQVLGGGADYRFPQWSPHGERFAYITDRGRIPGEASPFRYALDVVTLGGKPQTLVADVHPLSPPRWSPTGAQIAVAAGQECKRWGIYVAGSEAPARPVRRSNQCRFTGAAGDDFLETTPYLDIVNGLAGNDRIVTSAGDDRIDAGSGNDAVSAGPGNDVVFGGAGNDILSGGTGNDTIYGGPGRDKIGCGPGRDVAYVGPGDTVRDCERVVKSP
jgi:hypothetical protein